MRAWLYSRYSNARARVVDIEKSSSGALGRLATVSPPAPTVLPVPASGTEGAAIALDLGVSVANSTGQSNTLASVNVSAIPVGAILTDGTNTFTAKSGSTSVDVVGWNLSTLKITPADDANFTLDISATEKDGSGNSSAPTLATEAVTVNPLAPTLKPVSETGVEGAAIALNLGASVNSLAGDSNAFAYLLVSAIPVGATLTDGTNSFTAKAGSTSVNVSGWALKSLTITPVNDANFALSVAAIVTDAEGNIAVASATEAVKVDPLAPALKPVAESGAEGAALTLNLGASVKRVAGDTNTFASLTVAAIPIGATLSDGTNSFTATTGSTSVNVAGWTLSSLTITTVNDANFTLTVTATEQDKEDNLSAATTASEKVTVDPLAPGVVWAAQPIDGVVGTVIALGALSTTINGLSGDKNVLASLVISAIPIGDTLSDGKHSFTSKTGSTSVNVAAWSLSKLTITSTTYGNFTLTATATEKDAEGNSGATATATETVSRFTVEWTDTASGDWGTGANWSTGAAPTPTDTVLIDLPVTVTISSGANTVAELVASGAQAELAITGGSLTVTGLARLDGGLSMTGGSATFDAAATMGSLTQTGSSLATFADPLTLSTLTQEDGGAVVVAGAVTATGAATFGSGYMGGTGTTTAEDGATFIYSGGNTFGLDGGRTLVLEGSSFATGSTDNIDLNDSNPYNDVDASGSGMLTIASGATFDDETTGALNIYATYQSSTDTGAAALVTNDGTFEKTGSSTTSTIGALFGTTDGTVEVTTGTLDLSGGGTDTDTAYTGAGTIEFGGGTRTLDAKSSVTTSNVTFGGGQTTLTGGFTTGATSVSGGTATIGGAATMTSLSMTGGAITFDAATTTGSLTQTGSSLATFADPLTLSTLTQEDGGAVVVAGAVTATGAATFGSGYMGGTGTTTAEDGATFIYSGGNTFGLDGGRTLVLEGSSFATGSTDNIDLNDSNPYNDVDASGSGMLTIASGATFDDETTGALNIYATYQSSTDTGAAALVTNDGTLEKTGSATTSTIGTAFTNVGTVSARSGELSFTDGASNSGKINVAAGATLLVDGAALTGAGTVNLQGAGATADIYDAASDAFDYTTNAASTLWLDDSSGFSGTISGWGSNTVLDLADMTGDSTTKSWAQHGGSGILTLTDASETAKLTFEGTYTLADFVLGTDSSGGVKITY